MKKEDWIEIIGILAIIGVVVAMAHYFPMY